MAFIHSKLKLGAVAVPVVAQAKLPAVPVAVVAGAVPTQNRRPFLLLLELLTRWS